MKSVDGVELKEGTYVLLTNPSPNYEIGISNPVVGSEWECVGMVTGTSTVRWNNGKTNSYRSGELSEVDPFCVDIWNRPWE